MTESGCFESICRSMQRGDIVARQGYDAMMRSIDAEVAVNPTSKEFKPTFVCPELTQAFDPDGNRTLGLTDSFRKGYGRNAAILAFEDDLKKRGLSCRP